MSQEHEDAEAPVEDAESPPSIPFSIQVDRWLSQEARFVSWCPTMDLVAVAYVDNSVWIHRLSYERLYVLPKDEKTITALDWRPDGKAIVLGYSDGGKSIWNIENGEKMFALAGGAAADVQTSQFQQDAEDDEPIYQFRPDNDNDDDDEYGESMENASTNRSLQEKSKNIEDTRIHKQSIKGIGWYQDQRPSSALANLTYANRLADVLPPLKYFEDSEDGTALPSHQRHQSLIFASQSNHLNVMVSYDTSGDIVLTAHGIFALGRFNAFTLLRETYKEANMWTSATVVDATLSQDLTRLLLMLRVKQASGSEDLLALPVDTSILAIRRKELEQISWQSVLVGDTMNLINSAYSRLQKAWENTSSQLNQKLKQFQQMLAAENVDATPEQELTELLLCGTCSGPTEQFLTHSLRSAGAKRFAKVFEQTFDSVDQLIFSHLQPAIQNLFALLSQLEAMASWKERMEAIGISDGEISEAKKTAGRVLLRVESLLRALARHRTQVTDLFMWLQKSIGLLELDAEDQQQKQQAMTMLAKLVFSENRLLGLFKTGSLSTDPITAILGEPESKKPQKNRNQDLFRRNIRTKLFEDSFGPSDDFSLPSEPLGDLLKKLSDEVSSAFASVGSCISKNTVLKCQLRNLEDSGALLIHNNADQISLISHQNLGRNDAVFSFVHNSTIWLLQFLGSTYSWNVSGIDAPAESKWMSVTFYSQDSLACLSMSDGADTTPAANLQVMSLENVDYSPVEMEHVNKSQGLPNFFDNIVMARPFEYVAESFCVKQREFPKVGSPASLSVAAPRGRGGGLAAILGSNGKRLVLLDIESEEDPEEPPAEGDVTE